jgi:hypothetical protein
MSANHGPLATILGPVLMPINLRYIHTPYTTHSTPVSIRAAAAASKLPPSCPCSTPKAVTPSHPKSAFQIPRRRRLRRG